VWRDLLAEGLSCGLVGFSNDFHVSIFDIDIKCVHLQPESGARR